MSIDTRRADLERNLAIAEQSGYSYVADQNRRLLAALDAREGTHQMSTPAAPSGATAAARARALRQLVWSWLQEEPEGVHTVDTPVDDPRAENRATALAVLEQVREAQQFLASWTDRLIRIAADNDATNPEIGAALGVGKNAIWKRLRRESAA